MCGATEGSASRSAWSKGSADLRADGRTDGCLRVRKDSRHHLPSLLGPQPCSKCPTPGATWLGRCYHPQVEMTGLRFSMVRCCDPKPATVLMKIGAEGQVKVHLIASSTRRRDRIPETDCQASVSTRKQSFPGGVSPAFVDRRRDEHHVVHAHTREHYFSLKATKIFTHAPTWVSLRTLY